MVSINKGRFFFFHNDFTVVIVESPIFEDVKNFNSGDPWSLQFTERDLY